MADQLNPSELCVRTRLARGAFHLDVDFSIPPGITILFGPSGAGKSTLLDCVAGLISPDEGRISISNDLLFDSATHLNLSFWNIIKFFLSAKKNQISITLKMIIQSDDLLI